MEVFINRIPPHCTERDLKRFMKPSLAEFNITNFICEKLGNKACAKLIFLDVDNGKRFLCRYGKSNGQRRPLVQLNMNGYYINCAESKNKPDEYLLRSLKSGAAQSVASAQSKPAAYIKTSSRFDITQLRCGVWSYINGELAFVPHFADSRPGTILFGHRQLALLFNDSSQSAHRIYIRYFDVDTATTGDYERPTITFTLQTSPRFYCKPSADIADALANFNLLGTHGLQRLSLKKKRVTSINNVHAGVVSTCFVYQVQLANYRQLSDVFHLLKHNRYTATAAINHPTPTVYPSASLASRFKKLDTSLMVDDPHKTWPFDIKFQLLRLARNGVLPPDQVLGILPTISLLMANHDDTVIVESLRRLYQSLLPVGPHSESEDYSLGTITNNLLDYAQKYDNSRSQSLYELLNRHAHIVLVHKLTVTPTGVYLEGPEPEVSNRVLRDYKEHLDCFLRVTFTDEDGEPVRYDGQSDQKGVYARFKSFLESKYSIAGKDFSFLGFSHSSLQ